MTELSPMATCSGAGRQPSGQLGGADLPDRPHQRQSSPLFHTSSAPSAGGPSHSEHTHVCDTSHRVRCAHLCAAQHLADSHPQRPHAAAAATRSSWPLCAGRCRCTTDARARTIRFSASTSPGTTSCRREFCHLLAPPVPFIRCFNMDKQGGVIKMTARHNLHGGGGGSSGNHGGGETVILLTLSLHPY